MSHIYRKKKRIYLSLMDEPEQGQQEPWLRLGSLTDGRRCILLEEQARANEQAQAIRDEDPDAADRMVRGGKVLVEAGRANRRRLKAAGLESVDQAPPELAEEIERVANEALEAHDEILGEKHLAVRVMEQRLKALNKSLERRRLAIFINRIGGDWSLHDDEIKPTPEWPPLVYLDYDDALDVREKLLAQVDEEDLERIGEAVGELVKKGAAGMTEGQKKSSATP